jgi:hypothetical protein
MGSSLNFYKLNFVFSYRLALTFYFFYSNLLFAINLAYRVRSRMIGVGVEETQIIETLLFFSVEFKIIKAD